MTDNNTGKDTHINVKIKAQDGTEIYFKIKRTTQMKKLMDEYCQKQGLQNNQCKFIFDGERLLDEYTPDMIEMNNGDEIEVLVQTVTHINIMLKVNIPGNVPVYYKVKRTTQLKNIMDTYCQKQCLQNNQCKFIFAGKLLEEEDTPDGV